MDEDEEGNDVESDEENEENRASHFYTTTNPKYNKIRLPNIIKIKDPLPGEVALWQKRRFPKAVRIHKKREDDPHRFFLS